MPTDGYHQARNANAWALGQWRNGRFDVRRVVWGRLLAREEKRPDEQIVRAIILIHDQKGKP